MGRGWLGANWMSRLTSCGPPSHVDVFCKRLTGGFVDARSGEQDGVVHGGRVVTLVTRTRRAQNTVFAWPNRSRLLLVATRKKKGGQVMTVPCSARPTLTRCRVQLSKHGLAKVGRCR